MGAPARVQLRRTRGWRKPANTVVVARPSKWGNPYRMVEVEILVAPDGGDLWCPGGAREAAVTLFRRDLVHALDHRWIPSDLRFRIIAASLDELRGKNLACWCRPEQPCHADVLLDLANR